MNLKPKTINFEIEGICPIKYDRWTDLPQPKNEDGYIKQAEHKLHKNKKGEVVIPANALKSAMRLASSEVGKKMEAKKNRQTIMSAVFFESDLSLGRKDHDGIVSDVVTRKGTGDKVTRVKTFRPIIYKWKAKGKIHLFGVPQEFAKECMELAGFRYGLLGHRAEFGRFKLTKWKT